MWRKAHRVTLEVYRLSRSLPKEEKYGLTSQLQRAVSSIPMNIAEGCGRGSDADFARYIYHAIGSANEVEYQLILLKDLRVINLETYPLLITELQGVRKMLNGLLKKLRGI